MDYIIFSQDHISRTLELVIGEWPIKLKSDHNPIFIKLDIKINMQQEGQSKTNQKNVSPQGRIFMTHENQKLFNDALKQNIKEHEYSSASTRNHFVNKVMLVPLIHKALDECKRSNPRRDAKNTFVVNLWFDEECKMAKRKLRQGGTTKENKKAYEKTNKG